VNYQQQKRVAYEDGRWGKSFSREKKEESARRGEKAFRVRSFLCASFLIFRAAETESIGGEHCASPFSSVLVLVNRRRKGREFNQKLHPPHKSHQ